MRVDGARPSCGFTMRERENVNVIKCGHLDLEVSGVEIGCGYLQLIVDCDCVKRPTLLHVHTHTHTFVSVLFGLKRQIF